jgi:IstB-like ATP binding protein
MIFTTSKPLNQWGKVLHNEDMAAAILDRVLERGRFIHLDGPSGRTGHLNPEEILPAGTDRARISGISGPEFLEPTFLVPASLLRQADASQQVLESRVSAKDVDS